MDDREHDRRLRRMAKAPLGATFVRVGDGVRLGKDALKREIPYARDGERSFWQPVMRNDMRGEVMGFAFHTVGWLRNDNRPNRRPPGLYRDPQNVYVRFENGQIVCVSASALNSTGGVWEARIEHAACQSNDEWGAEDVIWSEDGNEPEPFMGERFADLPPTFLWDGDVVHPSGFRERVYPLDSHLLAHPFDDPQHFRVRGVHFYQGRGNGLPGWEDVNREPRIATADRCFVFAWNTRNESTYYTDQQCQLIERGPVWREEHEHQRELTFLDLQEEANYRALKGEATEVGRDWYALMRALVWSGEGAREATKQIRCYESALNLVRDGEGHGIAVLDLGIDKVNVEHHVVLRYHDEDLAARIAKATLDDGFLVHRDPRRVRPESAR